MLDKSEYPNDWKLIKLGEIADFKNGLNYRAGENKFSYHILSVASFQDHGVIRNSLHLPKVDLDYPLENDFQLVDKDLVFVRSNGNPDLVGRCVMVFPGNIPTTFSGFTIRARIVENKIVDSVWVHICLKAGLLKKSLKREGAGTNITNLNQQILSSVLIPIPSIREQKALAAILSAWDAAIEKTEQLISSKSELILGVIQKVIGRECKHWRHINIADMFACISEKKYPDEELLSVTQDQGVIPRSMLEGRVMSPQGSTEAYKLIVPGDFVVSLRSFQGGIEYSKYRGLISPAYTVLRPKVEINVEFYKKFFKTNLFIEKYLSTSVIGIRDGKQISIPDLLITKIPLPSLQEQKKIVLLLDNYTSELDLLKELRDKYRMQKQVLMQKLLTGKWRVNFEEEK